MEIIPVLAGIALVEFALLMTRADLREGFIGWVRFKLVEINRPICG
jgi:hypothetical protein